MDSILTEIGDFFRVVRESKPCSRVVLRMSAGGREFFLNLVSCVDRQHFAQV